MEESFNVNHIFNVIIFKMIHLKYLIKKLCIKYVKRTMFRNEFKLNLILNLVRKIDTRVFI